jgi:DNA processing protein
VSAPTAAGRRAWAYLSRVVEAPTAALHALLAEHGAERAAALVRTRQVPPGLRRSTEARHHLDTAEADLARVGALGGRLVTPEDAEWPGWKLHPFATTVPAPRQVPVLPVALWVRGPARLDEITDRAVSVVGTRDVSGYGEHVTAELCHDLAADGWTVVSGAAYGVDGAAHRAALTAGGPTVAVLGCGIDRAYPAGHAALLARIAEAGLVVSEHPPGTTAAGYRFLARNRLVAGLGDGVLVVEAGWRSGARSTARWARELARPALAVPGPVTSLGSTGCHQMIRTGEAVLVTTAAEVVEHVGRVGELAEVGAGPPRPMDGVDAALLPVLEALPRRGSASPQQISESSGVPLDAVRAALPELELDRHVVRTEDGWALRRGAGA